MGSSTSSSMVGISCFGIRNHESTVIRILFLLFLGQLVSFTMAIVTFSSSYLATLGVDAPITQSFFTYFCLVAVYGSVLLFRRQKLLVPCYYYIPLGFVDVQANYLVVKAFQYSSITSVTLLDCWTIPWVIILTFVFLGTRYSLWQYVGAATCIIGLCLVLFSDAGVSGGGGSRPLLGDFLVIAGTLFYALSNVGEEYFVKQKDIVEVISMLGVFGLLFSICEIALLERHNLEAIEWSTNVILAFAGYALATFLFYSLVPFVLKLSGATLFNLSLLTSDMWAVLIRIFFYHQTVDWLYYVSFAIVVVGLIIYSKTHWRGISGTPPGQSVLRFAGRTDGSVQQVKSHFENVWNLIIFGACSPNPYLKKITRNRCEKNPTPIRIVVDGHLDTQYAMLDEESKESTDEALIP